PTQTIAAIAMRANMAQKMLAQKPQAALKELQTMEEMARRTTQEIRHMLFTLRPLVLETQGLVAALEAMAEKMRDTYGQNVLVEIDPQVVEKLEMEQQSVIFAIAEEAVNNARKHAEAEHIWVRLRPLRGDIALLEIRDDGVGFDAKAVLASYEQRGSLGLLNLRERSELINGIFHLDSEPGKGTRVQVAIPLTEAAIERLRHRI
ncbi:MAG: histidine kinase, partial [Anaerolineae bacterium]